MLLKEEIVIREWRPNLGGRYIYEDGRVVELDSIPTSIDWEKLPIPYIPPTKPDYPSEFIDRNITVRYFGIADNMKKAEPLAKFDVWESKLKKEDHAKRIEEIIEINKGYRFNAAATELEARKMFNGRDLSINEAFRCYTSEELREAVAKFDVWESKHKKEDHAKEQRNIDELER